MKKIIQKILVAFSVFLIATSTNGQLPLQQGDMVITYKYGLYSSSNPFSNNVVSIIKSRNTSTATPGQVWGAAGWYSNPNWTAANLGDIFGITIDNAKNIYLSSSSIYGAINPGQDRIMKIDANTEAISTIASNAINPAFVGPYGNLKCVTIGANEYMYVSDWGNGFIHRLKKIGAAWLYQNSFNPEFGRTVINPLLNNKYSDGQLPYGLNVRKISGGQRLYYSRMGNSYSRNFNTGMTNYQSNEIWYIELDNLGNFITTGPPNGEFFQSIPYDIGNGGTGFRYDNPISDIAFKSDGKKMLLAQQPLISLTSLGAHSSEVRELTEAPTDTWSFSGNNFPTGERYTPGIQIYQTSSVGGISYSNNILYGKENDIKCDTTVWAVSDFIFFGSAALIPPNPPGDTYTYGLHGYTSSGIQYYNGTTVLDYQNSLLIDEDNDYTTGDKYHLGDVEVYNVPNNCNPCTCGNFTHPTLNGNPMHPGGIIYPDDNKASGKKKLDVNAILPMGYRLSFVKGNVTGLFNIGYACNGPCEATTKWTLKKDVGGATKGPISGTGNVTIDLSQYNQWFDCGTYTLTIVPYCDGKECPPFTMKIDIICEPTSCCPIEIKPEKTDFSVRATTNPNGTSILSGSFSFSASSSMSEVRMNVEEFRLKANSENCLLCKNRPNSWGNIISANLNGIPGKLYNNSSIPSPALPNDYREAVFNNGLPISMSNANLRFRLGLPAITDLECCEVTVYLCIKVTFKDANCKECVQMICKEITLKKQSRNDGQLNDKEASKTEIFKVFN